MPVDHSSEVIDVPNWYRSAMAQVPEQASVDVAGAAITYFAWGKPDAPGLVLIHGGAAHALWWAHVAPLLAKDYRVVALDLSGHGRSARRDEYPIELWAREVVEVARVGAPAGPPVVIGHSMGGFVGIATAARHDDDVAGLVVLDSPVITEAPEVEAARLTTIFRAPRTYDNVEEMVARFRTVPPQDHYLPYVLEYVARNSIRPIPNGFTWAFDPKIFSPWRQKTSNFLAQVRTRVALFRAERGLLTEEIGRHMYELLDRVAPVVEVPEAGHHLMLDQPLLLVACLRTLLADWQHSIPFAHPEPAAR